MKSHSVLLTHSFCRTLHWKPDHLSSHRPSEVCITIFTLRVNKLRLIAFTKVSEVTWRRVPKVSVVPCLVPLPPLSTAAPSLTHLSQWDFYILPYIFSQCNKHSTTQHNPFLGGPSLLHRPWTCILPLLLSVSLLSITPRLFLSEAQ